MDEFVVNGFLVEKPPNIFDRLLLPLGDELAIPRLVNGEIHQKLHVYKKENGKWGIQVRDMYKSDLDLDYEDQITASKAAHNLLMMRYL